MELQIACTGYNLAVDWYEGNNTDRILLVLPGYNSSKKRQQPHAEAMVQASGTNALVVDLSGHGSSPFELRDTRPAQHLLELICVFDWLKQKYPAAVISISGSSYGGFLAAYVTKYRKFANLILRAPAIYEPAALYDVWSSRIDDEEAYTARMSLYRQSATVLAEHPLFTAVSLFKGKVLVVVHENDEIVPRQTTDSYINAFKADSFMARGFSHTIDPSVIEPGELQTYQAEIANWLRNA